MSEPLYDINTKPPTIAEIEAHGKMLGSSVNKKLAGLAISIAVLVFGVFGSSLVMFIAMAAAIVFLFLYTSEREDFLSHSRGSQYIAGRDCDDALTYRSAPSVERYLEQLAVTNRQLNYSELAMLRAAYLQHDDSSRKQALYGGVRP